jgi:C_GCAxxG_C_C family probable redox protein
MDFYRQGYNCSQSILKAAEIIYRVTLPELAIHMCGGVNGGLGTGGVCCALIGGIMTFGLLFDEETAKGLRIQLLDRFQPLYGSINCCVLSKRIHDSDDCEEIIGDIAKMVQEIIEAERVDKRIE